MVLAFGNMGQILLPTAFSLLLVLSESYLVAFSVCGIPAALAGVWLLAGQPKPATPIS